MPDYLNRLAGTHNNTGILLTELGRPEEALKSYGRAEVIRQRLADAHHAVPEYQRHLATLLNNTAILLSGLGRSEEALKSYGRAEAIQQRLADAHPAVPGYLNELASTLDNTGLVLSVLGSARSASRPLPRLEFAAGPPDRPSRRPSGPHRRHQAHYNLACLWALTVGTSNARDAPPPFVSKKPTSSLGRLHHLAQARRYGYFATPQKREHFARDTDFAALCGRPDFQAFVTALDEKVP